MLLGNKPIGTCAYLGGLPCLLEEFCWSWSQMVQFNSESLCGPGEYVHYERSRASFHAFARNNLADIFQGEWLLMLDTDHQFEPDICLRLLDRLNVYDADVVVGMYQHKSAPYSPVLYLANEDGFYCPIGAWGPSGDSHLDVFTVDSSGAGCMMIRRRVFDRIRNELHESPFDVIPPFGEDHSFAKRLGRLGIKILCDPRIEAQHLRVQPVTMADYDRSLVRLSEPRTVEARRLVEVD